MNDPRPNLVGLSEPELIEAMAAIGEKPFRAKQLWHWIYHRGETDFATMTTLAKPLREKLADSYVVHRPKPVREQISVDGTRKWLVGFDDGNEVETVYIPEDDRGAVCISSQIGCPMTCRFCHTGTQALVRNLTAAEIVGQFMLARDSFGEWPSPSDGGRLLSNVVMMGMGEPLLNYDNVIKALAIIMDGSGIALSRRRITLSTSGVAPMIRRLGRESSVNLAISLHAVTDEIRDRIMPINRTYPLAELFAALRDYPASNARRITFEYLLLKDVNDSLADAHALVRLVSGIPAKFNLIPFNEWPGSPFERPSAAAVQRFSDYLFEAGYSAPVRQPRGTDILAACGQLRSDSLRRKAEDDSQSAAVPS
ncbi:MAG: 23S rRNA (adenine(2503)-C(2))-methyltransferase RlmN [Rhodospirillaceae bacterium]|nr:23S rRNA (adenine(2503)-C(2))-methyltransferase RlmN [Rhodospirillaceae bacterium]